MVVLTRPPGCVQVQPDLFTKRSQPSSSRHGSMSHHCLVLTMRAVEQNKGDVIYRIDTYNTHTHIQYTQYCDPVNILLPTILSLYSMLNTAARTQYRLLTLIMSGELWCIHVRRFGFESSHFLYSSDASLNVMQKTQ